MTYRAVEIGTAHAALEPESDETTALDSRL